jgi:N-acetylated-alpha-linked acidic dipeptidase
VKPILALLAACAALGAQEPIRGFPENQWAAQREFEKKAAALPEPGRIQTYLERMAKEPHHAGSPASGVVAEYALGLLQEFGLDAHIENFEALLPYPVARSLEMVKPVKFRAALKEPVISQDSYTSQATQLPTYNAYSASGDVTAPVVYVNYGVPEDYDYLAKQGIDVKGKIVIVRYGKNFRGTKPKIAAQHGAIGCLIYSDPRDDGYFRGDPYPQGPMRPPNGVQRGSVMDIALYPGDPLSPGWASEPGSKRLSLDEAKTLTTIPVLPISYADATPFLENLAGPVAPEGWRGALGFTYHIGPGPATAHFKLSFDNSTRPLRDVIAVIPGKTDPDEWIIYGNHHDAWVNGASDPISGASSLLETARSLATLRKRGWQPRRTIVLALWDGEEFGLVGSTEWAEKHQEELDRKAVVYINSDSNGKGALGVSGSHSLETFMTEVLRDLTDPESGKSLLETARTNRDRGEVPAGEQPPPGFHLSPLGSGSDYTAFIDHLGIASLNLGFGGEDQRGVYHSIYDDPAWFERFGDPGFVYGAALSRVATLTILRLADAPLLPFEFGAFTNTVRRYVDEIKKQAGTKVDFDPLLAQLEKTESDGKAYESAAAGAGAETPERLTAANRALFATERGLTVSPGLPGRDWYRHRIYAPGAYTGYAAKTLPGIREAVEAARWEEAGREVQVAAQALGQLNQRIEEATRLLGSR